MKHSRRAPIVLSIVSLVAMVCAAAETRLSSAGLGAAQFGMSLQQVEQALGSTFQVTASQRAKWQSGECTTRSAGMPGTSLVFAKGRFSAAVLSKGSSAMTRSGLAIGNAEAKAIATLKGDPTYRRAESRYSDGKGNDMDIIVGKADFDKARGAFKGNIVRIFSQKGRIVTISAGQASYVMLDEHDDDSCP